MATGADLPPGTEERVLVLAPTGRDALLACDLLSRAGLESLACADEAELCRGIEEGAAVAVLAEEALHPWTVHALLGALGQQGPWSDLPLIVFTRGQSSSESVLEALGPLGNATLLERPVRVSTLVSAVKAGMRARHRQYEVRDLLQRQAEADRLTRIFEPFTQVESARKRSEGGLGLGLPLVRSLVELHGGTVEARSEGHGKGSEFLVRLPRLPRLTTAMTATTATAAAALPVTPAKSDDADPDERPPLHILVVEDNPDGRESLRDLLEIWGHEVDLAENGPDGVKCALGCQPDVALIDIGLPGLDGNEVAQRIRAAMEGDRMALIAMTGYGQPEDRRRALQAGFDAYLVKPVDPGELARTLRDLTAGGGSRLAIRN